MNFGKNLVLPHRDSSGLRSLPVNERDFKTKQKNALQPNFVEKKMKKNKRNRKKHFPDLIALLSLFKVLLIWSASSHCFDDLVLEEHKELLHAPNLYKIGNIDFYSR